MPQDLIISLRYGNLKDGLTTAEMPLAADGTYRFEAIPYKPDSVYFAVTNYQGISFQSEVLLPQQLEEANDLPIILYEHTENATAITLTNISIAIDRTAIEGYGTGLIFSQTNTYRNESDSMLYRSPEGQDIAVSLLVQLPPGALILNDQQGSRYIVAQDFYALIDTLPVYPGEHTVEALYFLPYETEAVIDLELNNRLEGTVDITMAVPSLTIEGDSLEFAEDDTLTIDDAEISIQRYEGEYVLAAGENLVFDIRGALSGQSEHRQQWRKCAGELPTLRSSGWAYRLPHWASGIAYLAATLYFESTTRN